MKDQSNVYQSPVIKHDELIEKDRWHVTELGLEPDRVHSSYYLDFSGPKVTKLRYWPHEYNICKYCANWICSCSKTSIK